jgi:hypothetical protein
MNTVRGIARDLVDKRLWPVATLLGLGIVAAIAIALSASGGDPAQAAGAASPGAGMTGGVVIPADEVELNADRELVGGANDPFRRQMETVEEIVEEVVDQPEDFKQSIDDPPRTFDQGTTDTPPSRVSTGPVQTPEPAARREPDETFTLWEVDARVFRDGTLVRDIGDVAPLTPLPTAGRPLGLFLGVFNGGSSAGFVIHRFVEVKGSNCEDRAKRDCSLLRLGEGSNATLSVEEDGREITYQIVVDDIRKVTTRDERRATRHRERRSSFGSCLLKTVGQDYGAVLFDPAQGTWSAGGSPDDCYER